MCEPVVLLGAVRPCRTAARLGPCLHPLGRAQKEHRLFTFVFQCNNHSPKIGEKFIRPHPFWGGVTVIKLRLSPSQNTDFPPLRGQSVPPRSAARPVDRSSAPPQSLCRAQGTLRAALDLRYISGSSEMLHPPTVALPAARTTSRASRRPRVPGRSELRSTKQWSNQTFSKATPVRMPGRIRSAGISRPAGRLRMGSER